MAAAGWSLTPDAWLGTVLARAVSKLTLDDVSGEGGDPAALGLALASRPGFTYTRVRTTNLAGVRFLEAAGLHLVDTSVVLEKPAGAPAAGEAGARLAAPGDLTSVRRIAREGFRYSRFHLDPCMPDELANRVKEAWVESYFDGRRGDAMVVRDVDGDAGAFLALLVDPADATVIIDLIAVDARYRKRGFAGEMIRFAERHFAGAPRIRVSTQLANVPSLRMYETLGFRVVDSSYVFHHHGLPS